MSNSLAGGQGLVEGASLESLNGDFSLVMQTNGDLAEYATVDVINVELWGTERSGATNAQMQTDGNFVLYDAAGHPKWASNTEGHPGAMLLLEEDGAVAVVAQDGTPLWTATPYTLLPGQGLVEGASLESLNGGYRLVMQGDGNLVEYVTANGTTVASWATGTNGSGATNAQMETDGDFVLYDAAGNRKWASNTGGNPGARLVLDDYGGVAVVAQNGHQLWAAAPNTLLGGQGLIAAASLGTPAGVYSLVIQVDGNLVEYVTANGTTVASWATGTVDSGAVTALMQTNGDFVLYDASGNEQWSSHTEGNPGARLLLEDDGTVAVIAQDGTQLWAASPNTLLGGQGLVAGTSLGTPNGAFTFAMQPDGNLVLYANAMGVATWASGTNGSGATNVQMQPDGNLVLSDASGNEQWSSRTDGNPGARLLLEDDGAAAVIAQDGTLLWAAPSMPGSLVTAFIANNSNASVLACWSADGVNWTPNIDFGQSSKFAPSLTVFNSRLYVTFIANDPSNTVYVCSSPDGRNWTQSLSIGQFSKCPPSLAVFNGRLHAAFIANDPSNAVLVCSSADGSNWSSETSIGQFSSTGPSLAVFNGRLHAAFIANDSSNAVLVCSSADGTTWSSEASIGQTSPGTPSLAVFDDRLYAAFVANDSSNAVLVCSSADGTNWTQSAPIGQSSDGGPSLAVFNGRLYVAFAASSDVGGSAVLVCSSADGTNWTPNTNTGQTSDFSTPALASYALTLGYAFPAYKVLTLVYAPPGTNGGQGTSSVTYGAGSTTGTKTTTARSFKSESTVSADIGFGGEVGKFFGADASWTASTTTTDTTSLAMDKGKQYQISVDGPPEDGIDHDDDAFYLWLNPALPVAIDPENNITWGIGVDGSTMLVQYVYASWLKDPSSMPSGVLQALTQAGVTEADFSQILALDPFSTDPDAPLDQDRFLPTGQSFPYEPPRVPTGSPATTQYTQTSATTTVNATETNSTYSVSTELSAGLKGFLSASLKVSGSLEWTDTSSSETEVGASESASVSVGGPAYGYTGPTNVLVYWDTVFKSFFFAFASGTPAVEGTLVDASGAAAQGHPVELHIEGKVFKTFTDSQGRYRIFDAPAGGSGKLVAGSLEAPVVVGADAPTPLRLPEA